MANSERPVTLITGTSRGIGKGLCDYFLAQGHIVIGCGRSKIENNNENYIYFQCDITDEKEVLNIFKFIKGEYKRLDNLINNAGIGSASVSVLTTLETFERVMKINTSVAFLFMREASKMMIKNRYGRIVNITSAGIPIMLEGTTPYLASKAALEMLTKSFANELAGYNITVNAVGPSTIGTDMRQTLSSDAICKYILEHNFMIKEETTIKDLTNVIDFLLRKESKHLTSQIIYLCGPK